MSKPSSSEIQDAHNKGQEDRSKGDYNPPVGVTVFDEMTTDKETLEGWNELDAAYNKGWNNRT